MIRIDSIWLPTESMDMRAAAAQVCARLIAQGVLGLCLRWHLHFAPHQSRNCSDVN